MGNIEQYNGPPLPEGPNAPWMPPYKASSIKNAAELVIVFDAVQLAAEGYNASVEAYAVDHLSLFGDPGTNGTQSNQAGTWLRRDFAERHGINLNLPVDGGTNQDAPDFSGNAGNIRWRHLNNRSANFLFADGHVEARGFRSEFNNDLLRMNLCVYSQPDINRAHHF
jgi:prepilin-type processing-associated H-X9-DG protein